MPDRLQVGRTSRPARFGAAGRLACVLAWLFVWALAGSARAADADAAAAFESANKLYEEGQFKAAAEAYEKLVASGRVSSALYFNAGNAWFKAGDLGRAIFNYRLAERLAPRDPDLRVNLRMARELVNGEPLPAASGWRRWVPRLTLNEWAFSVTGLLWVGCALLAWGELRPAQRTSLRRWTILLGVVALLAAVGLGDAWHEVSGQRVVIVKGATAVVRHGPLEVSPELETVPGGTELEVTDRKDGWLEVAGLKRGPGWIEARDVLTLP
jgi:hypothetical protein